MSAQCTVTDKNKSVTTRVGDLLLQTPAVPIIEHDINKEREALLLLLTVAFEYYSVFAYASIRGVAYIKVDRTIDLVMGMIEHNITFNGQCLKYN